MGFSHGGDAAVQISEDLDAEGYSVDLLFLIDPIKKPNHIGYSGTRQIPSNVKRACNYRQNQDDAKQPILGTKIRGYGIAGITNIKQQIVTIAPPSTGGWGDWNWHAQVPMYVIGFYYTDANGNIVPYSKYNIYLEQELRSIKP